MNDIHDRHPLHPRNTPVTSLQQNWWTTSGGTTFIPPGTETSGSGSASPSPGSESSSGGVATMTSQTGIGGGGSLSTTTYTTNLPFSTFTSASSVITLFTQSLVTSVSSLPPTSTNSGASSSSGRPDGAALPDSNSATSRSPVCIGGGLDAQSDGLLASLIIPTVIGLLIWLLFAILRPRFRQIYAVREWFVQQDIRPKPLGSGFFAWLFPHVPLVPDLADDDDVDKSGQSVTDDAEHFPSDGQLSQRVLWIAFMIALGWSFLGLAGALPLYLIQTTCLANQPNTSVFGGAYSTLQDLSLLRLLRELDTRNISTNNLAVSPDLHFLGKRADSDDPSNIRPRIIVLTVFAVVLALFPALWKITKELNKLAGYRRRWLEGKCQGKDIAWLSARDAPGFVGWGEKQLKDFVLKTGLSSSLDNEASRQGSQHSRSRGNGGNGEKSGTRRTGDKAELLDENEKANLEVDINGIFSICETQDIALLIEQRDEILENLEIAETKYITSFKLSTPEPSLADFEPSPPRDSTRPYISRPIKYGHRRKRSKNPAPSASSLAPTSFVAPSHYYKIGGVSGVSGGHFTDATYERQRSTSFSDTFHQRIIGSRFQELNRDSANSGHFPLGSPLHVRQGTLEMKESDSVTSYPFPDPRKYGPNYAESPEPGLDTLGEEEWVDLSRDGTPDDFFQSAENGTSSAGPSSFRRRPLRTATASETQSKRETFPFRKKDGPESPEDVMPPHLRLQQSQPFVRPLDGVNYDHLGDIYSDIAVWRTKLKQINADIADAQRECYSDIAEGVRIKGWLFLGQGLRHIPKMQLIEGRSKDDVRWDILQNERTKLDHFVYYGVLFVAGVLLAAGLTAATGLALATAPDFSHYLPFLQGLWSENRLAAGVVTVFVPALAISVFIYIALRVVLWASEIRASVSVSAGQLHKFQATFFFLTIVSGLWIVAVGALLFGIQAFSDNDNGDDARSVANGSIYIAVIVLAVVLQVAIIFPGLLILQPMKLWRVTRQEKYAITPRQRFRAVYPHVYEPHSFTTTGACVLAVVFISTFALIFPLIGPAVVILLLLTMIAHRYLIGYVYAPNASTGGLLQMWLLRRLGTLLAVQPILLGLIFLSRRIWIEGGVLVGTGVFVIIFVETFAHIRMSDRRRLSNITKDSVETFASTARTRRALMEDEESTSLVGSRSGMRPRGSMASVLEMMSLTLAVMPSPSRTRGPVPLKTESLDDLLQTERAAQTHPDAPPHLPALPFADHAEEMSGILYAPELIAPPPIIWLPNDRPGVGRSEALDLQKYHDLQVTLDVGPASGTPTSQVLHRTLSSKSRERS